MSLTSPDLRPLAGINVLEIAHYIAGPHCAMILADHGADVVKIEPLEGERGRHALPLSPQGDSLYFACHNRGKRSIALDLRHEHAREVLDPLLAWADIVVTNHMPGVPERRGFGFERLSEINPRASLVHLTGYGLDGPFSHYVAFDGAIQAMSGFSSMTGEPGGEPLLSAVLIADHSSGAHAALAAMMALRERDRTGKGRLVEISMLRTLTSMLAHFVPAQAVLDANPTRQGSRSETRFVDIVPARDGGVYVAPITPGMWRAFCRLVGREECGGRDPRDASGNSELRRTVEEAARTWMAGQTAAEAVRIMQAAGIACGAVRSIAQLYADELAAPTGSIAQVATEHSGTIPVPGPSFRYPGESETVAAIPPLGAGTRDVLERVGLAVERIDALATAGAIRLGGAATSTIEAGDLASV